MTHDYEGPHEASTVVHSILAHAMDAVREALKMAELPSPVGLCAQCTLEGYGDFVVALSWPEGDEVGDENPVAVIADRVRKIYTGETPGA